MDGDEERWAQYATAVLRIEVERGVWVALNGPDSAAVLPVRPPVFLLTAWDPFGERRTPEENAAANERLATDLQLLGAEVLRAIGSDARTGYGEEGFAVVGVPRDDVIEVARHFDQEAIYEVDADAVAIVSCVDGRAVGIARTATVR